jgi:hypothetical protein
MDQATKALNLLEKGTFKNLNQAARRTGIPRSTLRDRAAGIPPTQLRTTILNRLTLTQEACLVAYIRDLQLQYMPVNHATIRQVAEFLTQQNDPTAELGINWVSRFIKRHPELSTGRNRAFEKSRIQAAIPQQLEGWYTHIQEVVTRFNIAPDDTRKRILPYEFRVNF